MSNGSTEIDAILEREGYQGIDRADIKALFKEWLEQQYKRTDIAKPQSIMYQSGWSDAFELLLKELSL